MKNKNFLVAVFLLLASSSFAQTIDYSLIPYRKGSKWGYADASRSIVIAPKYDDAQWFSEGLAAVKVGKKWGYINRAGKLVIPARYTVAKSFRKGYMPQAGKEGGDSVVFAGASVDASGYEKCINAKGVILPQCPAISETSVAENLIPVGGIRREKTYSLPNNNGLFDKITDDYKIAGSDETYYIAQKGGMYGVFNSKFETIVPFEYSSVNQFRSGQSQYLQVEKNGMRGVVKGNGEADILPAYSDIKLIKGIGDADYVIVKKDGKSYVKDLSNNDVISTGYSDIVYDNNGGFVVTDNNNYRGFYFDNNKSVTPKYSDVKKVNRGSDYLQIKTSSGKVGYINSAGDEFFVE